MVGGSDGVLVTVEADEFDAVVAVDAVAVGSVVPRGERLGRCVRVGAVDAPRPAEGGDVAVPDLGAEVIPSDIELVGVGSWA